LKEAAQRCGIDLIGVTSAEPLAEHAYYLDWVARGNAAGMGYLTDHRAHRRADVREILPTARAVIVAAVLYNTPSPSGPVSRYAWGRDYHDVVRQRLEGLVQELPAGHDYRVCVDTVPVLERALARRAGLGWIGKNTCLINQGQGSWFFLGEVIWSLELEADAPPADRCGTCTRCIEACPTAALDGGELDARLCIAYLNIELKGTVPEELRGAMGRQVFGCDICQDVCPWNRRAAAVEKDGVMIDPPLERLAALSREEFSALFAGTPVERTLYQGFLRNVCIAMGNARLERFRAPLERLAAGGDIVIQEHARWALRQL